MSFLDIKSQNLMGSGERYHDPLRVTYQKIRYLKSEVYKVFTLGLATKTMNDTRNPEGLVPSLPVFGVLAKLPTLRTEISSQMERMKAIEIARTEMETITAELQLQRALLTNIPSITHRPLEVGQDVLVYRENENPHWTRPCKVTRLDGKQVSVDRNGKEAQYSFSQTKPYVTEGPENTVENLFTALEPFRDTDTERVKLLHAESLQAADPRSNSPKFMEAKKKESKGLTEKGTWKVAMDDELNEVSANLQCNDSFNLNVKP